MEPDPGTLRQALRKYPAERLPVRALQQQGVRREPFLEQVRALDPGKRGQDVGRREQVL
ncbi:unnamed protein product [Linum tenue]|uniref:Uncharacterized protein n=1 Tax=Linum tenue TaxID=586396 RepID=A0AAV0KYF4_9ROSI|nr:unnamed protein product [Linum tenue]